MPCGLGRSRAPKMPRFLRGGVSETRAESELRIRDRQESAIRCDLGLTASQTSDQRISPALCVT